MKHECFEKLFEGIEKRDMKEFRLNQAATFEI